MKKLFNYASVDELVRGKRLDVTVAHRVAEHSQHVFARDEIGGLNRYALDERAFVAEVRGEMKANRR